MTATPLERAKHVTVSASRHAATIVRRTARPVVERLAGSVGVLAYHRVAAPDHDPWALTVTPHHFDEQVAVLQELGRVAPLEDALGGSTLARFRRRQPTFAITFDDGYVDNLVDAITVLERHDAPATVFIVTGVLDQSSFWWDELAELTFGSGVSSAQLIDSARILGLVADASEGGQTDDLRATHDLLYEALSPRTSDEI
jgi:peptidoglycan/xylan/chitin deacetylase (PgdA/CDA1 family)